MKKISVKVPIDAEKLRKKLNIQNGKDAVVDIPDIVSKASAMTEERLMPFIPKIEDLENDLPKLGEKIRDGLELLQGDNRLDISAIKGLSENIGKFTEFMKKPISMASIAGRDLFHDIDLSTQLNGITLTFSLPAIWTIISISLSSFPYTLRKNVDYTFTPTSVTFLIDPTLLATGQTCVLTVINS